MTWLGLKQQARENSKKCLKGSAPSAIETYKPLLRNYIFFILCQLSESTAAMRLKAIKESVFERPRKREIISPPLSKGICCLPDAGWSADWVHMSCWWDSFQSTSAAVSCLNSCSFLPNGPAHPCFLLPALSRLWQTLLMFYFLAQKTTTWPYRLKLTWLQERKVMVLTTMNLQ